MAYIKGNMNTWIPGLRQQAYKGRPVSLFLTEAQQGKNEHPAMAPGAETWMTQVLRHIGHEMRMPLNSIIGFANILLKNRTGNLQAQELDYLERVLADSKHLLHFLNDFQMLSLLEAGQVQPEIETVQLDRLIGSTLEGAGIFLHPNIQLRSDCPERVAPIAADGCKLQHVLTNLIRNAARFTHKGDILVRIWVEPEHHVPVCIDIRDNSPGISVAEMETLFDGLYPTDPAQRMGIELKVSKALCQLLGYDLKVSSEVGAGITFSLLLLPQAAEQCLLSDMMAV